MSQFYHVASDPDATIRPKDTQDVTHMVHAVMPQLQDIFRDSFKELIVLVRDESLQPTGGNGIKNIIPEYGLAGHVFGRGSIIKIGIDTSSHEYQSSYRESRFNALFAHEVCHIEHHHRIEKALQQPAFIDLSPNPCLAWSIASEGLAIFCETELFGQIPFYALAQNKKTLHSICQGVKHELTVPVQESIFYEKVYIPYFFNRNPHQEPPYHAGYALGYALMNGYLRETGKTVRTVDMTNCAAHMVEWWKDTGYKTPNVPTKEDLANHTNLAHPHQKADPWRLPVPMA